MKKSFTVFFSGSSVFEIECEDEVASRMDAEDLRYYLEDLALAQFAKQEPANTVNDIEETNVRECLCTKD